MATDAEADKAEYDPPLDRQAPLNVEERLVSAARRQAQDAGDPVPPVGGAYRRERFEDR